MKTYLMTRFGRTLSFTLKNEDAKRLMRAITKTMQVNHYSLQKRESEKFSGYTMEYWTPTPQWALTEAEQEELASFYAALPSVIKKSEKDEILLQCTAVQKRFESKMFLAGEVQS